jgi:heme exporter protein A
MLFQVENLACRRGPRPVFRNLEFALDHGEALFVAGPNGSGKSSLLRILAGLLPAAQGSVLWAGGSMDWGEHKKRLHYIGHQDAVKPELTVAENLDYWRALRAARMQELPAELGLDALRERPVRILSAGQKRRLALARLLLIDVPLWLLDEPATSLDRDGQEMLAGLIAQHRAKGGIAVIASHHEMNLPAAQKISLQGGTA